MKQLDNYIIVDVGANLTNKKFARDLDSVIKRAKEAGMYRTCTPTYDDRNMSNVANIRNRENHGDWHNDSGLQRRSQAITLESWRVVLNGR